jgi:hypothetical protein
MAMAMAMEMEEVLTKKRLDGWASPCHASHTATRSVRETARRAVPEAKPQVCLARVVSKSMAPGA